MMRVRSSTGKGGVRNGVHVGVPCVKLVAAEMENDKINVQTRKVFGSDNT
jgi:hypothetical protein